MPCDGSHVLFIGGYHHSGTGAVTHALKTHALGLHSPGIDAEVRDRWPPAGLACEETWQVWKHPTNVASEVHKMLGLRRVYPNMTLVFLERDLPNVVWSIIKRFKSWLGEALVHRRDDWCAVRHAWRSRPPHASAPTRGRRCSGSCRYRLVPTRPSPCQTPRSLERTCTMAQTAEASFRVPSC